MNLDNLVDRLQAAADMAAFTTRRGGKNVYLAGGWFSKTQEDDLIRAYELLAKNPDVGHIHVPLLHQYGGSNPIVDGEFKPDQEWATATFLNDVEAINQSDVVVCLIEAADQDTGTVWESAYAYATHKPVIMFVDGDVEENPVNLMAAQSVTHFIDSMDEFSSLPMYSIGKKFYTGKMI